MKLHFLNSKIFVSTIVILAIVFIGALINWGSSTTKNSISDSTLNEINQIAMQLELLIEDTLEESVSDLLIFSKGIEENVDNPEDVIDYLNSQAQVQSCDKLFYIDLDGKGMSLTHEFRDFSTHTAFLYALERDFYITEPQVSLSDEQITFNVSVPVLKNGEVIAVLFNEASLNNFFDILNISTTGSGDMYFIDSDFNLIFSTNESYATSTIFPESDRNQMGEENLNKAYSDLTEGTSGGFHYNYFDVAKVMVYHPIEMTDWALAMNVAVESFSNDLTKSVNSFILIGSIVYWTVIALVIYLAVSQYRSNNTLEQVAYYDTLTGLPNIEKFKSIVKDKIKKYPNAKFTMQKMDIVKFSVINEIYGMDIGDKLLLKISDIMSDISKNIEPTFACAKVGIDEFIMISANGYLDQDDTARDNDEIKLKTLMPELDGYDLNFRYGRYFIEQGETDIMDMISKTTIAHNIAKLNIHQKAWDYNDEYKQELIRNTNINNKRKAAIENEEFKVYLQPKFSASDGILVGAEALVRWVEDDGKVIFPNDFIPLFEKNGFIVELDQYMLESVCKTIKHWMDIGLGPLAISVNCSRLNLDNPFFVSNIVEIVDKYDIPHRCIEIELTESIMIESEATIEKLFIDLHKHGFKISIDDFGAGYSSLGILNNLHVDTLKMDRTFFIGGKNARRDDILINSIIKMSHNLGMFVVAEGIETHEQVEMLKSMNCDAIQGYVYAKPMPVSEFEEKYHDLFVDYSSDNSSYTPLIKSINDARYAYSFVPCGILIIDIDEHLTLLEANKGYFDIIGYTREELRDIYNNRGCNLLHPDDLEELNEYLTNMLKTSPNDHLSFVARTLTKKQGYITIQMSGKYSLNEHGEHRLYISISDISSYAQVNDELQQEKDFVSRISSLTNNVFFDYHKDSGTIRFSKNFADRFNIPEIIENFLQSDIRREMFPNYKELLDAPSSLPKSDGEFCIVSPNGDPVWYIYSYKFICDEKDGKCRVVGKMSEALGHKLELDILKVKSETNTMTSVYNQQATERYIRNYLRLATSCNDTGAFYVIRINNIQHISNTFGSDYADLCLKDVGSILRNTFRNSDIIGRSDSNKFFVFINNYKAIEFVEKRANELCEALSNNYEKEEQFIKISTNLGISLYPEHGNDFESVYQKACKALDIATEKGENTYAIYK